MVDSLELDWSQPLLEDNIIFPPDKLDRAKYATFLTKLLSTQGFDVHKESSEQKQNYVLNLNSEWGAGKTYFLKRWSEDIKPHYPVVYIDAWKQDYSDDPLMTVISSIIDQLRVQAGEGKDVPEFKVPRKLIGLLKAAAPGIAKGLFKRYIGIDPVEVMASEDDNEILGNIKDENGEEITDENGQPIDMSFAASEVVKYLISEHDAKKDAIESLKISVFEWVNAVVASKRKDLPAFIFIDELDRCRPSYAVEMLETVKHIFDIKGVVFVIATDTEQLQHAVKAVYGEGFNAKVYLSRFFNSRYSLKAPNLENFLEVHTDLNKLSGKYLTDLNIEILPFNKDAKVTLSNISLMLSIFEVSARTAIQIADRVVVTISNMPKGSKVDVLMLTALLCIKEKDSSLFEKVVKGGFEQSFHKGDASRVIKLDTFFESYFPTQFNNNYFRMNLNPQLIATELAIGRGAKFINEYPVGCYKFTVIDYFKTIFAEHFHSTRHRARINTSSRSSNPPLSPLQKIGAELQKIYFDNRAVKNGLIIGAPAITWIKYIYIKNGFESIDMEEYKDFVELASPLDWMGKDELPELE